MTAQDDGTEAIPDTQLLDRASTLGRVLFTFDDDLLAEAKRPIEQNIAFGGVIYVHL
jgi:hypothetical protein